MRTSNLRPKAKQANALVTVLGVLFIISTMAVSFAKLSHIGMFAAKNHGNLVRARLVSEGGLEVGIAKLKRDFRDELFCNLAGFEHRPGQGEFAGERNWCYTATEPSDSIGGDDTSAAGIVLEKMSQAHPSYATELNGRQISGFLDRDSTRPRELFTLKIFDTTSQLNLNNQLPPENHTLPMVEILNNLSLAIAKRAPYRSDFNLASNPNSPDAKGPLSDAEGNLLGEAIMAKRTELGGSFSSKYDLLHVEGVVPSKLKYVWDFVTTHTPLQDNLVTRNFKPEFANELEPFRNDARAPININTAPWPVLVAALQGLRHIEGPFSGETNLSEISAEEAERLATLICRERVENRPFGSWEIEDANWQSLRTFLESNLDVFDGDQEIQRLKAELVYANGDPNVSLRRLNPDKVAWQPVNKTDLDFYTTEFTFYPHGIFEITSLGQILSPTELIVEQAKTYAVVKVFDVLHKTTQLDFQSDQRVESGGNAYEEKQDLNAFSYVNNLQKNGSKKESIYFGYIQPVVFDLKYGIDEMDNFPDDSPEGNLRFKTNFNNGRNGIPEGTTSDSTADSCPFDADRIVADGKRELLVPPPYTTLEKKNADFPAAGDWHTDIKFSDLLVDGVLFRENSEEVAPGEEERKTLCYQANGNIPNGELGERDGMLAFWFKLGENPNWSPSEWRTVFFSTSVFEDTLPGEEIGIQMEVQMRWRKTEGIFEVQARRKVYRVSDSGEVLIDDVDLATIPSEVTFLDAGVRYQFRQADNFGVRPHEWYHLAVLWQNGTDLKPETSPAGDSILLSGNFYTSDDPNEFPISGNAILNGNSLPYDEGSESGVENLLENYPNDENGIFIDSPQDPDEQQVRPGLFEPLEPQETGTLKGRFYLGAVFRNGLVHSSSMTIDDIRILENPDEISFDAYNPTRYPPVEFNSEGQALIAKFNGSFASQPQSSVVLGTIDWTRRIPLGGEEPSPFVENQGGQVSYLNEFDSPAITPISRWNPQEKQRPVLVKKIKGVNFGVWKYIYEQYNGEPDPGQDANDFEAEVASFAHENGNEVKRVWNKQAKRDFLIPPLQRIGPLDILLRGTLLKRRFEEIKGDIQTAIIASGGKIDHGVDVDPETEEEENGGDASDEEDNNDNNNDNNDQDPDNGQPVDDLPDEEDVNQGGSEVLELAGDDNAKEPLPQENELKPVTSPGQAIANDGQIQVLPPETQFDYQLRFVQSSSGGGDALEPQFLTPLIDDFTITFQGELRYIEKRQALEVD